MKDRIKYFFVPVFIIILIVSFGCRGKDRKPSDVHPSIQNVSSGGELNTTKKLVFGTLTKTKSASEEKRKIISETGHGNVSEELQALTPSEGVSPEDMIIGQLQDFNTLPDTEKKLYVRIEHFFKSLSVGIIEKKDLNPLVAVTISRTLKGADPGKKYTLRIGEFQYNDNRIQMRIRILTPLGRSSGKIMAEIVSGVWYISDISLDFDLLKEKYVTDNTKFEPESYMNVRLEYE